MIVVSDTTPLIGLATINQFELLYHLFGKVYIPQAVYDEAVVAGREEGGAKNEVSTADWIEVVAVEDRLAVDVLLDDDPEMRLYNLELLDNYDRAGKPVVFARVKSSEENASKQVKPSLYVPISL